VYTLDLYSSNIDCRYINGIDGIFQNLSSSNINTYYLDATELIAYELSSSTINSLNGTFENINGNICTLNSIESEIIKSQNSESENIEAQNINVDMFYASNVFTNEIICDDANINTGIINELYTNNGVFKDIASSNGIIHLLNTERLNIGQNYITNNYNELSFSTQSIIEFRFQDNSTSNYKTTSFIGANGFTQLSDASIKSDLKEIDNPLEIIDKLKGYDYFRNDIKKREYGFIAQDVQKVLPSLVNTIDDGLLGIDYQKLIPIMLEAIKSLIHRQ